MSAAGAIAEGIVGAIEGLVEMTQHHDEATAEEARQAVERVRAAAVALPVLETDGEWDRDEAERLERG